MDGGLGRYILAIILWAVFYVVIVVACIIFGRAAWDTYQLKIRPWLQALFTGEHKPRTSKKRAGASAPAASQPIDTQPTGGDNNGNRQPITAVPDQY